MYELGPYLVSGSFILFYSTISMLGGLDTQVGIGGNRGLEWVKISPKSGPEIVFSGAPGRGVLRFLKKGYRNPVHKSAKNAIFSLFCQT